MVNLHLVDTFDLGELRLVVPGPLLRSKELLEQLLLFISVAEHNLGGVLVIIPGIYCLL